MRLEVIEVIDFSSTPGSCPRLWVPKAGEVLRGATVGEDIEEAQELPVDPARGGHGTWEEGVGSAIPVGVPVPVALHLFACLASEDACPPPAERTSTISASLTAFRSATPVGAGPRQHRAPAVRMCSPPSAFRLFLLLFLIVAGLYCVTARPKKWGG